MLEHILEFLDRAGGAVSLVGVAVIAGGFLVAAGQYAANFRRLPHEEGFSRFKVGLGRALMLGVEILVVADVIETITVKPTIASLTTLAGLVLIRTFISWTLTLEVEGRWPWQRAEVK